jgi:hypothetical protein
VVAVREDTSGLLLLDTRTNEFVRIASASTMPTFATGLSDGRLVYQLSAVGGKQLWIFDPLQRTQTRVGASEAGDVIYRAKTSDNRIVYSAGSASDMELFFHNPRTGVSREIAEGASSTVTVAVNVDDLVFYEVSDGGQSDVYAYDPADDTSFAIGTADTDEQIQTVLPNGAVVFSRVGGGGEADLFYYRVGTGLVEIGSDIPAIATNDKVVAGHSSDDKVVFMAQTGAVSDVFAWNPANGQTAAISGAFGAGAVDVVDGIGAGNEVVFHRVVSGSEVDVYFYDLDDATSATVRDGADVTEVRAIVTDGTTAWAVLTGSGAPADVLAVSLVGTPATETWSAGGAVDAEVGVIGNGDVVARRTDGSELNVFDVSAGTWGTPIAGAGLRFAGPGLDEGDFVYEQTASAQIDLSMWDASLGSPVVVSDVAGDDAFAILTDSGTILFTRVVSGNTNTDLFVWDGGTATRLTDDDEAGMLHDHEALAKYAGSR